MTGIAPFVSLETTMSINRLLYWCDECQAYTYNDEDHHCAICNTERN